jgi:hypothetical protein
MCGVRAARHALTAVVLDRGLEMVFMSLTGDPPQPVVASSAYHHQVPVAALHMPLQTCVGMNQLVQ